MFSIVLLAVTAPLTLACMLDENGRRLSMTLRLDEAQGAVRYALPATAPEVTARALFVRERVMFDRFTLDRASLAIARDGDAVTTALGAQPGAARGRCRVRSAGRNAVNPAKTEVSSGKRGR